MATSRTKTSSQSLSSNSIKSGGTRNSKTSSFEEPSLRRMACDACRGRKIRCNRQQSGCARCLKMRIDCRYSARSKPPPSRMDLSRFLMSLDKRLKQTEAQLTVYDSLLGSNPETMGLALSTAPEVTVSTSSYPSTHSHPNTNISDHFSGVANVNDWTQESCHDGEDNTLDFDFSAFAATSASDFPPTQQMLDGYQEIDYDAMFMDMLPICVGPNAGILSPVILKTLYNRFFDIFHPIIPIINRNRFDTEISSNSPSPDVEALSYTIALLGSLSVPDLRCHTKICYEMVRGLLDHCESQESDKCLMSINTLQACTLLTLHELKQPNFARAWMTLGRAIKLANLMGLEQAYGDRSNTIPQVVNRMQLPLTSGPIDSEEKRRTFWALYVFDAFPSIQTTSSWAISDQISVPLPGPGDFSDKLSRSDSVAMPSLQEILDGTPKHITLSSFAGVVIMISLYRQCFDHINLSLHSTSSHFWETHYSIENSIVRCRYSLLSPYVRGDSYDDPNCLTLRMNLNTVEINLQETALLKAEAEQLPAILVSEAISKCTAAISDTVEAIQLGQRMTGTKRDEFWQLGCFLVWPITTAIESCLRLLKQGSNNTNDIYEALRVLSSAMKSLIDPEQIVSGLLEEADAQLINLERQCLNSTYLEPHDRVENGRKS